MASFELQMGLAIVGYPAVASSLGVVAARLTPPGSGARQTALVLAATAGLLTSHLVQAGVPKLPPMDSIGWVPITTACAGLLGVVLGVTRPAARASQRATVIGFALAAAIAVYLAGKPTFASSVARFVPIGIGAAAATAIALAGSSKLARRGSAAGIWIALLVTAALSGACALLGASASLATLLGSMATTAGVLGIGGLILRVGESAPAAQGVFIVHIAATVTYAHLYASLPALPTLLLAGAVALPPLGALLPGEGNRKGWMRPTLTVALAVVLAGAAVLLMFSSAANLDRPSV